MPGLVSPLNDALAYVTCPLCKQQGTDGVQLTRAQHIFKCPLGHQFTWQELQRFKIEMTPMSAIFQETPDPRCIQWKIYVLPETRDAFLQRYQGRVHITLGTALQALADANIIFIDGEVAAKLKAKGLGNGASILAAVESAAQMETERDQALTKLSELMGMLKNSIGNVDDSGAK